MPALLFKGVLMVGSGTLCGYDLGRLLGHIEEGREKEEAQKWQLGSE